MSRSGKRGPKKGHGGRPRGSYKLIGPVKPDDMLRRYWREQQRKSRKRKRPAFLF